MKAKLKETKYKDAVDQFNSELVKHPSVIKASKHYGKTPAEIVKGLQMRLSTKGDRGGDTKEVSIDYKDSDSDISIKHKKKFTESIANMKNLKETFTNPKVKTGEELAKIVRQWYDFATDYIDSGSQQRAVERKNDDTLEWFSGHPSDVKKAAYDILYKTLTKGPQSEFKRRFEPKLRESVVKRIDNISELKETIRSVIKEESGYQDFFRKALEKAGKSIPSMSDDEKKAFFNKIDAAWDGKGEKNEELTGNQHKLDVDGDGEIEASDLAALRAGKQNEGVGLASFDENFKIPTHKGVIEIDVYDYHDDADDDDESTGIHTHIKFNGVAVGMTDIDFRTGEVKLIPKQKRAKLKAGVFDEDEPSVDESFKIRTSGGLLEIEVQDYQFPSQKDDEPSGVDIFLYFNRVKTIVTNINYATGEVKIKHNQKRVKIKESVNDDTDAGYDKWARTRVNARHIFRMLKKNYGGNISKMKDGLEDILKSNKVKGDQAEIVRQEFHKYFKIKESVNEGNAFGMAVSAAKKEGLKEFEFGGKTYKVKKGSYEKNEAAKKLAEKQNVVVAENTHVVVSMAKNGYGTLMSGAVDVKKAEKMKKATSAPRGEEVKVITVVDTKNMKSKLIGGNTLK